MAESGEKLKSLLLPLKEESEKAGLKRNIKKTKIMASGLVMRACSVTYVQLFSTLQIVALHAPLSAGFSRQEYCLEYWVDCHALFQGIFLTQGSSPRPPTPSASQVGSSLMSHWGSPSGPITSWQTAGEKVEAVTDFIFLGSKITAAMKLKDACSLEAKR